MPRIGILTGLFILALTAFLLGLPQVSRQTQSDTTHETDFVELDRRVQQLESENQRLQSALEDVELLRGELARLQTEDVGEPTLLERHPIPETVEFCGETLPLDRADVRERFEQEWSRFLVNRHWLMNWHRRTQDVFPTVEAKLAEAGLPDDLKYVLVIESGVEARATSSAGAAGWWQFINSTGNRYGLSRNRHLDERRDLALSTRSAILYFTELFEEFQNWPLSLSAYNAGERRVREALDEQGESSFYDLVLPRETEAYWFKAAAAKRLLTEPDRYGITVPGLEPTVLVCDTLSVMVTRSKTPLREIADASGISYRELKRLNPSIRTTWLPRGEHRLLLPAASVDAMVDQVKGLTLKSRVEGEPSFVRGFRNQPPTAGTAKAESSP